MADEALIAALEKLTKAVEGINAEPLPYLIGLSDKGNFAYFPSGAIRRLGNTELQRVRDELKVRAINLSANDADKAVTVSKEIFTL